MVEHLLELIQQPRVLRDRIHPPPKPPKTAPPPSRNLLKFMDRLRTRRWLDIVQDQLMEAVIYLRREVHFVEHLPGCYLCKMELQLDVERCLGNHSTWYLSLENGEYLERRYRDCPKERNYHIGNYWEQVQYYREHGNCNVPRRKHDRVHIRPGEMGVQNNR